MSVQHKFVFLGNGSYNNHGCEAIVHGTMEILKHAFGEHIIACNGVSERPPVVEEQEKMIPIQAVCSYSISETSSFLERCRNKLIKLRSAEVPYAKKVIAPHLRDAVAMLALGGDNFSLEYGIPYSFLGWNSIARDAGMPVFIWGASVGPFSKEEKFERQFVQHARTLTRIFVRETETISYLTRLGLEHKLYLAADPAFAMLPKKPRHEVESLEQAVGINLSPLMAQFVTAGDMDAWKEMAVQMILAVSKAVKRPIALIPHVNATEATRSCDPGWYYKDDYGFLAGVKNDPRLKGLSITLLSNELSAPELKHEISRLWAFAGARTHATIAAFSTGVPCISLAYSVKARGLNKDVLGTTDFCISPTMLSPTRLVDAFKELEGARTDIIQRYELVIPKLKKSAYAAGEILKADIENHCGKL
jgi:polysaccharide pyruvyl transferase WcaK-like protein